MGEVHPHARLVHRVRRRAGAAVVDNVWRTLSYAGRMLPASDPSRHGVELLRDVAYVEGGTAEQRLDIYRPRVRGDGLLPVVLYVHGGGFRILSKDSHWVMGLGFARRGYLVCNIDYRLAPRHRYPAALCDAAAAYAWIVRNIAAHGGDPDRIVLAGESAGANIVASLLIASCFERPEPWARELFALGAVPRAVIPACGLLQVTDPERYLRRPRPVSWFVLDRMVEVTHAYLGPGARADDQRFSLADPLCVLEGDAVPSRPLPPVFAPVGTRDPLKDDTRRLACALARRNVPCEAPEYRGEVHAFHALVFRRNARRCWQDMYRFLDRTLAAP